MVRYVLLTMPQIVSFLFLFLEERERGIYLGGDLFELKSYCEQSGHTESTIPFFRFFFGFTQWGPKQLQDEIKAGHWVVANMTDKDAEPTFQANGRTDSADSPSKCMFGTEALVLEDRISKHLWQGILHRLGKDFSFWARGSDKLYEDFVSASRLLDDDDDTDDDDFPTIIVA